MKYTKEYTVNGFEIGPDYLLKHPLVAVYFQNTMACEFDDLGLAAFHLQEEGKSWVLTDIRIDYHGRMPRWRSRITVDAWTRRIQGFRIYRDFAGYDGEGNPIAEGTSSWIIIDEASRRPQKPDAFAERIGITEEAVFPGFRFGRLDPPDPGGRSEWVFTVTSFDIDFNNHMSNIRYITGALEAIPYEYRRVHDLTSITVKYSAEAFLGDEIYVECFRDGDTFFCRLVRRRDEALLCTVLSSFA
jgi:medium-chain acyl-[acyl-carrier-protein] hydrolase